MSSNKDLDLFELLNDPDINVLKGLKDEFFTLGQDLKKKMDAGLSPSDIESYRGVANAVQAASDIVDKFLDNRG